MRVYLKILLTAILLQGCTPVVKKAPQPVQPESDNSAQLLEERRRQAEQRRLRVLELEQQADFISAVRERISYYEYLDRDADIAANSTGIWRNLNRADKETLRELYRSDPRALAGWLELAIINRTMLAQPESLARALASWQDTYPMHPANPAIVAQVSAAGRLYHRRPERVALLLPMRGAFQEAATAVRDGFISAWYNSAEYRPPLRIYEANSLNIEQAYSQAVTDGAEFIVGPLEKQALRKLSNRAALSVPTLALNNVPPAPDMAAGGDTILPPLMQFSLSPEDEARQVAERADADGYGRALVMIPGDEWGRRLQSAFRDSWQAAGGLVLETMDYDPRTNDFGTPVKRLLNVDGSESRTRQLRQTLGMRLENRPRRRRDADMIFMAAFPIAARQLIPQLRFHDAGEIPVYATSHSFTGSVNQQADADMNGVRFPDLPWILAPGDEISAIKDLVNDSFRADSSVYQRLYAFGADAFNVIPHLARLAFDEKTEFHGATGALSMSGDGRISRKLPWGKIINGKPELLDGD